MQALLIKFLTPLAPYLAGGFFILAGAAYTIHVRHELAAAAAANTALMQTNQANAAAIATYQAQSVKWNAAVDTLGAEAINRNHAAADIDQIIDQQPPNTDAPVAPVLAQALADISKLQAGAK